MTQERRQLLALFGAEIIDSPGAPRLQRGRRHGQGPRRDSDPRFVMPYQYGNPAEPRRPRDGRRPRRSSPTALRSMCSWRAWARAARSWASVGRLKRYRADIRVYAAEPLPGDAVQGLRSLDEGFIPEIFDPARARRQVAGQQRRVHRGAARADRAGRGSSRGSPPAAPCGRGQRVAATMEHGTIVVLLADGGWKYLSEDVWGRDLDADARGHRATQSLVSGVLRGARRSGPCSPISADGRLRPASWCLMRGWRHWPSRTGQRSSLPTAVAHATRDTMASTTADV